MVTSIKRILATADLNWKLYATGDACTLDMVQGVCNSDADAFIIAGDIADRDPAEFEECLHLFDDFSGHVICTVMG